MSPLTSDFDRLICASIDGLHPFAFSLVRDRQGAQDLFQDTICRAYQYREKFNPDTNIRAWLTTIMRNIFINDYRRSVRGVGVMKELAQRQTTTTAVGAESGLRVKEIQQAIHELPPRSREACTLFLQGYKYGEIAQAMAEPLGTIKSRIHFARKLLQKKVQR